jgi:hypothetical protein
MDEEFKFYKSKPIKSSNAKVLIEKLNKKSNSFFYFFVNCDDDLIELIYKLKNNFNFDKSKEIQNLSSINSIKEINIKLNFKCFELSKSFRIYTSNRFDEFIKVSEWTNLENLIKIKKIIKEKNDENIRDLKIYEFENFNDRMEYIFNKKNREEDYYLDREDILEKEIYSKIESNKNKFGKDKDSLMNLKKIKIDFISHLFKKIKIKENFKYTLQHEQWGEEKYVIETSFECFNKDLLSIKEQKAIINRIFPSMNFKKETFFNTEILEKSPSEYNVKNHKINIIIDIMNKSKNANFPITKTHYILMNRAIDNHKLRNIMNIKLKNKTLEVN